MLTLSKFISVCSVTLLWTSVHSTCQPPPVARDSLVMDCTVMGSNWKDIAKDQLEEIGYNRNNINYLYEHGDGDNDEYVAYSRADSSYNSYYYIRGGVWDVTDDTPDDNMTGWDKLKVKMHPALDGELHDIQTIYDQNASNDDDNYRGKIDEAITFQQYKDASLPTIKLKVKELKTGFLYAESTGMDGAGNTQQAVFIVGPDGNTGKAMVIAACVNRDIIR